MSIERHLVAPETAAQLADWFANRGGVFYWKSADLSDPGWSCWTPARKQDGSPVDKPHWKADNTPEHITDPAALDVIVPKELKRFHVAVRMGGNGLSMKLTDASSRRLRTAVAKAQEQYGDAWYVFDYSDYNNAVVMIAESKTPMSTWLANQKAAG